MQLEELVQVSAAVAATPGRLEKISKLAALLTRVAPDDVPIAIGFLTGWPRQGRIGVGWASIAAARACDAATASSLELRDVDRAFDQFLAVRGKNSGGERARLLAELFSLATADEQQFLAALIIGEVRQGALEGVMLEAIARAAGLPADRVRRAVMMAGDLGAVARAVLGDGGETALAQYQVEVFALAPNGRPQSFQMTMRRFGRRLDVAQLRAELPLSAFFFDILLHDGESVVDEPLSARLERLDTIVPASLR